MEDRVYSAPHRRLAMMEGPRMFTELASLVSAAPFLYHAPRGDRHPVMVMPGFGASDSSTTVLRGFLTTLGYQVSPWELGRNLGPDDGEPVGITGHQP